MSKTTEHIIKNKIDVNSYDGIDDEYFTGPVRLKIAYLHGLESKQGGPKVEWLKSLGHVVFAPPLRYSEDFMFKNTEFLIEMFEADVIIGSSMGGRYAYYMGKLLNIPVMLLNPALGQDDTLFDAYSEIDKTGDLQSKVYLGVGENDDVISPLKTVDFLLHETDEFDMNHYMKGEHAHRTPVEFFKDFVLKFLPMINNNE